MLTSSTQGTQSDILKSLQDRGQQIQTSFESIKNNPLNFNILMSHIGILSITVHELIIAQYSNSISKPSEHNNEQTNSSI
jgi:hypothetical protein